MGVLASITVNKGSSGLRSFESSVPAVRQLLLSPALVPCFVLQLTTIALALEMRGQDIGPAHGNSSNSGEHEHGHSHGAASSSSSSSSKKKKGSKDSTSAQQQQQQQQSGSVLPPGAVDAEKCPCCVDKLLGNWQLAVERLPYLTPCHLKLFELLEVEPLAVLWAAAIIRHR